MNPLRFRLSADVEGQAVLAESIRLEVGDVTIEMECDKAGRVNRLGLSRPVPDYKRYLPTMERRSSKHWEMHVPENPAHSELLYLFQYLESLGSFWFGFRRIRWERAKVEWLPETDSEKEDIQVHRMQVDRKYELGRLPVNTAILTRLVADRAHHERLVVPMSFLREGLREFEAMRYLTAYFNFYFFLEDTFACGKWRTAQVIESFKASEDLCKSVEFALATIGNAPAARHRQPLAWFLSSENCENTVAGVLKLLVHLRGNLHHFSQDSTKIKGHPLNQRLFETPTYLIMMICLDVVTRKFAGWEKEPRGDGT